MNPIKYEADPNVSSTPTDEPLSDLNTSEYKCGLNLSTPGISIDETEHANRTEDDIPINIVVPSSESSEKPEIVDPIECETESNVSATSDELLLDLDKSRCLQCPSISTPDISIDETEHAHGTEDDIPINIVVPSPELSEKQEIVGPIKCEAEPDASATSDEFLSELDTSRCQCPTISTPDISIDETEHANGTEDDIPIIIVVPSPESSEKREIVDPIKCETEPDVSATSGELLSELNASECQPELTVSPDISFVETKSSRSPLDVPVTIVLAVESEQLETNDREVQCGDVADSQEKSHALTPQTNTRKRKSLWYRTKKFFRRMLCCCA
uniref:Uncharacterized protein n=1 Tax=Schizaphis graminum TaxID=13262 RepID=A0A2S2PM86_SCHGA